MKKNFLLALFLAILFAGCATTQTPIKSTTYNVTLRSAMIKINDVGFLHEYKNSKNLQIYNSGVNTANIKIGEKICVNRVCFSKSEFNQKFFGKPHYDDIFIDIITAKPIYNGQSVITTTCGYEQTISKILVTYEVCNNDVRFVDEQNRVKITLKELK